MKKNYFTYILALLAFTFSSLSASAQMEKADKLKSEIQAMNDKMIEAMKTDDHETLSAMYVDNVYSMPSYAPMTTTKQAIIIAQ